MKIIEYNDRYLDDVKDLLTELEEYLVSIDEDKLDRVHPLYHEKMALIFIVKKVIILACILVLKRYKEKLC